MARTWVDMSVHLCCVAHCGWYLGACVDTCKTTRYMAMGRLLDSAFLSSSVGSKQAHFGLIFSESHWGPYSKDTG